MAPTDTATASVIQIDRPAPPAIVAELNPLVTAARAFKVTDVASHTEALLRAKRCRSAEKGIEDHFEKTKRALIDAKRTFDASVDALIGPIAEARRIYDNSAGVWETEQRRIADEEQRRLQDKARKEEEERQLAAAQEAQDRGDHAEAESIVSETVSTPVISVQPQIGRVGGVSSRLTWCAEVNDFEKQLLYIVTGKAEGRIAHPELLYTVGPDQPALNKLAVAMRQNLSIPGVKAVEKSVRSYR